MKRYILITLGVLLLAWLFAGCSGSRVNGLGDTANVTVPQANGDMPFKPLPGKDVAAYDDPDIDWTWDLIAGQTMKVGTVHVYNDETNFYVEFQVDESLDEDWLIHQVHVYVGTDAPDGNGAPGQFTYVDDDIDPGKTHYLATIPFAMIFEDGIPFKDMIYVATHAVVCVEGEGGEPYGGYVGGATANMWAGKFTDCGDLTVEVDGDNLLVTYETTGGWEMTECQLYVETTPPTDSTPGQMEYKYEPGEPFTSYTFEIPMTQFPFWGSDGCLYIAAHAAVRLLTGYDGDGNPIYQTETAWSWPGTQEDGGTPFGTNWARYFQVCFTWDYFGGDPTDGYCETAWGGPDGFGTQGKYKDKYLWEEYGWDKKWGGYFTTCLKPVFTPFPMQFQGTYPYSPYAYWKLTFTGTPQWTPWPGNPVGGWCVDPRYYYQDLVNTTIYSCYDPDLPGYAQSDNWDLISYMLDQRMTPGTIFANAAYMDFQEAVWYFKYGLSSYTPADGDPAWNLINAAKANGEDYCPGDGDYFACILWPGDDIGGPGIGGTYPTNYQMLIIAVDP